jgi:hypothetical protein
MGKHLAFALILAAVVPVTATGQVATYKLIDPVVAGLLSGSSVTTNTNAIAEATTGVVQGAAADGTTQVILRIPASSVGQKFTVTVINDAKSPSDSVPNDGGVLALGDSPSSAASSLAVTAVSTSAGAEAFAIYLAPVNFSRSSSDYTLTTRSVTLQVSSTPSGITGNASVTVARPPVVLVHGLWGSASSFDTFTPLITDYRTSANVASVKADIVAHSMGGDVSRTMFLLPTFLSNPTFPTFGAGPINKLITIATPHLGTPVAADLLASNNACVRNVLAGDQDFALASITFSGQTADGAVGDLEGNGFGSSLSPALANLKQTQPFKTAYIAGIATSVNLNGLNCIGCTAQLVRTLCSSNPLAKDLTAAKWSTIYGQSNDTIVPLDSALNNLTGQQFSGVIHTAALETLDFKGPSVLDAASNISSEVINLLNEEPTGSDFH